MPINLILVVSFSSMVSPSIILVTWAVVASGVGSVRL